MTGSHPACVSARRGEGSISFCPVCRADRRRPVGRGDRRAHAIRALKHVGMAGEVCGTMSGRGTER
jgi:hypothetical protein